MLRTPQFLTTPLLPPQSKPPFPMFCHLDHCSVLLIGLPAAALVCLWTIFNTADRRMLLKYVGSDQKPMRAPYPSQSKTQGPHHGPQNQLLLSHTCPLVWAHQSPCLSVNIAGHSASGPLHHHQFLSLPDGHITYPLSSFKSLSKCHFLVGPRSLQPFPQPSCPVLFCFFNFLAKHYH